MSERLGIYFGLSEADYFSDPAISSTDIRRLLKSAPDYWFLSPWNPLKPSDDPTPSQYFGRAVHRFVLEGEAAFMSAYAPTDFPGNRKEGKAEREAIEAAGKLPIKRDDFNRIAQSAQMIRANEHLRDAFQNGHHEVSVFWKRDDGLRLKCRMDYLKIRAVTDLKSTRNTRQLDFAQACIRSMCDYHYEIQAEHYLEGRRAVRDLWRDRLVFGDHDAGWMKKVANSHEAAFVFVFWQAEGAPITWSCSLSPGNPILETARREIEFAFSRYRDFESRFGLNAPWVLLDPVKELSADELPAWAMVNRAA